MTTTAPLAHTTLPPERFWNTWSGEHPAEMVFLPLGVRLTPLAFAASTRKATLFPAGAGVHYGRHALDGSLVECRLSHAGTALDLTYRKPDRFDVVGEWRTLKLGEWGLRFWMVLCLSSDSGAEWTYDPDAETLSARFGHRHVAVRCSAPPLLVTAHDGLPALVEEYERHGYWHLASRAEAGKVVALRFHLEEMPSLRFAVSVRDDAGDAALRASELAMAEPAAPAALPGQSGRNAGALDAVRDVMAWNTVFDRINRRPYVSISRNWNQDKFGGFGVWLNDQQYATYLVGLLDGQQAHENQMTVLAGATPDGNLPCLLTANDAWVDRTQLPIGSFLAWLMHRRDGSRAMLELAFPTLLANHRWWWRRRDARDSGLVAFGNSHVGTGLYKGTGIGARDESIMDNSPMHDEARFDKAARTLDQWDVGLNSILALDAEMLGRIAAELGRPEIASELAAEAEAHRARICERLWDDARGIFANRLWSGRFARSLTPSSFWPLLCGAASPEQARRMLAHLEDETSFGGEPGLPSVQRSDPAFHDNVYWRGRVWPPLNWLVWQGLRRYGFEAEARRLARQSWQLFEKVWRERRLCPENYNAVSGEPLDQPDTDGFYGWGALMPALAVAEVMDVSAWHGWEIANEGADVRLGPLATPVGLAELAIEAEVVTLTKGGRPLLVTDVPGRLRHIRLEDGRAELELPAGLAAGRRLELPGVGLDGVLLARQGTASLEPKAAAGGIRLSLAATRRPERVVVVWAGGRGVA